MIRHKIALTVCRFIPDQGLILRAFGCVASLFAGHCFWAADTALVCSKVLLRVVGVDSLPSAGQSPQVGPKPNTPDLTQYLPAERGDGPFGK